MQKKQIAQFHSIHISEIEGRKRFEKDLPPFQPQSPTKWAINVKWYFASTHGKHRWILNMQKKKNRLFLNFHDRTLDKEETQTRRHILHQKRQFLGVDERRNTKQTVGRRYKMWSSFKIMQETNCKAEDIHCELLVVSCVRYGCTCTR